MVRHYALKPKAYIHYALNPKASIRPIPVEHTLLESLPHDYNV